MTTPKPYEMSGTPKKNRLVPPKELLELLNGDPGLRKAVDTVEKIEGKPRAVTMMVVNMLKHHRETDMYVEAQKRAIDLQVAKQKGILNQ